MQQLIAEVEPLLTQATAGAERCGLMRLRTIVERCAEEHGELVFVGDRAIRSPSAQLAA
jgi:hypothetical protein